MTDAAISDGLALTPRKRNHEGELIDVPTSGLNIPKETSPTPRHGSPTPSTISSLTELTSTDFQSPAPRISHVDGPQMKKPKLTFHEKQAEKAAKKQAHEERKKALTEEKARKEQEKNEKQRKKEEEKEALQRRKELEKAEKDKVIAARKQEKDARRQEKEAEKAKLEAEKLKKDKSQMKLVAFFGRPAPASTPPSTPDNVSEGVSSRRSSIASVQLEPPLIDARVTVKATNGDFDRWILPFFVPEFTELAPFNQYRYGQEIDLSIAEQAIEDLKPVSTRFVNSRRRLREIVPVRELLENQRGESQELIDLAGEDVDSVLRSIPYKYIHFYQDVRPPYQGTYTRRVSPRSSRKISRNPFHRGLPNTNYDYDSEAEWEPPAEDDEDLNDEDEISEAEDNEEEMDDFLDDEDDVGRKRGLVCDMVAISTGICWEGEHDQPIMSEYKMDVLHDSTTFPINPYSTSHWSIETKLSPVKSKAGELAKSMQPPRLPLSALSPNSIPVIKSEHGLLIASKNEKAEAPAKQRGRPPNPEKPLKMIEPEFLPAFKQAIEGNDLTKAGLIEILKKQFPKCSKDAIKDTLGAVAIRVGKKEAEKVWQIIC